MICICIDVCFECPAVVRVDESTLHVSCIHVHLCPLRYLALVCLMRSDSFTRSGLVEYNFACFKKAIAQLFEAKAKLKSEQATQTVHAATSVATSVQGGTSAVQQAGKRVVKK